MKHSDWMKPTTEEIHELEVNQIEEAKGGNGNGNNNSIPINSGMWVVLLFAVIFGLWTQSRTSQHFTSESSSVTTSTDKNTNTENETQ